jgi:hypothetical protein
MRRKLLTFSIATAASACFGIVFFFYFQKPHQTTPSKLAPTQSNNIALKNFNAGYEKALQNVDEDSACLPSMNKQERLFCFEGYYAGKAVTMPLLNFDDLSFIKKDSSLLYYRAKYVGLGTGMSIRGIDKQTLITKVKNSKFKRLIISGWAFSNFIKHEKNIAASTCEGIPPNMQNTCLFSIGRAALLSGFELKDILFTDSKYFFAGYSFAHSFTNSQKTLPLEIPGIEVGRNGAALYKEILGHDSKSSSPKIKQLQDCLENEEKIAYDCFVQI